MFSSTAGRHLAAVPLALLAVLAVSAPAQAAWFNDNFASATVLPSGTSSSAFMTTAGATKEAGEPIADDDGTADGATVWFKWTPAQSGGTRLASCVGALPDQVYIRVYTGSTVGGLTPVPLAGTPDCRRAAAFVATAGTTYRIQVDTLYLHGASFDGATGLLSLDQQLPSLDPRPPLKLYPPGVTRGSGAIESNAAATGGNGECKVDGKLVACVATYGIHFSGLGSGQHTVVARFRNIYGNWGTYDSLTWTVDAVAPQTTVTVPPIDPASPTFPAFAFSSDEPGVTYECMWNDQSWVSAGYPCTAGPWNQAKNGYSLGPWVLNVRAIDPAGNVDATPVRLAWTHVSPPAAPPKPKAPVPALPGVPTIPRVVPTAPQPAPRPSAPPVPIAPRADSARFALLSVKAAKRGAISVSYRLTRPGRVEIAGRVSGRKSHAAGRTVAKAGTSRLTLRPTRALLTALRAGHTRRVRVVFTLTSLTRRSSAVRTVTLRLVR